MACPGRGGPALPRLAASARRTHFPELPRSLACINAIGAHCYVGRMHAWWRAGGCTDYLLLPASKQAAQLGPHLGSISSINYGSVARDGKALCHAS